MAVCRSVHECWGVGSSLAECITAVQQRPVEQMAPYLAAGSTFCIRVHAYGHSFTPEQQHDLVQQFRFLPVQSALSFTAPDQRFWLFFDYGDERARTAAGVEAQTRRVYFCRELASSGKFVHHYSLKTRPYIGPTSMPADLAFLYANQALASPSKLVYDPFVGTGSLLVACAHFGATVVGSDLDWKILHGLTVGGRAPHHIPKGANGNTAKRTDEEEQAEQEDEEAAVDKAKHAGLPSTKRLRIDDNFRHYKLPRPELVCSDQSLPVWARAEVFDAIVSDPPYGVRAGARRSGRKGEVREVPVEFQSNRIPPSQLYDVEDVVDDLLDMAARTLKLKGRLVYLLPTTTDFSNDELPRHPCLSLVCVSEQIVRTHFSRRLITMEKCTPWSADRNIQRRDRATQLPPKYANIKDALLLAAANAAAATCLPDHVDDEKRESKRAVKRHQRYVAKREHKQRVKAQGGPTAFPSDAVLLFNACIYADCSPATFADPYTWMVIRQERVLAVGRLAAPMSEFAESERRRNMDGKTIVPGLIDSHIHVYFTGKRQHNIDLSACNSIQDFQHTIQQYQQQHPHPTTSPASSPHWHIGIGWEHDRLGRYPSKADVDAVVADQPVFLWRACYHVAVANTAALRLAGITADTVDPPGGSIDRDEQGRPTGLLREKAAGLVESLIVETAERRRQYVEAGLDYCLRMGLTCVQTNDEGCWSTYKQLADEAKLPLRVFLTIMHAEMGVDGQPAAGQQHGPLLSCHRIKMFADGALGAETAALTQPYVHRCAHSLHSHSHTEQQQAEDGDKRDNFGILIYTQEGMNEKVKRAHELGYRIEMHVIGDRAAEMAVQAFKAASIPPTARPILTHCQVLSASLLRDMKELHIVADIQPQFATTDCRWVDDRLSPALQRYAYIWRTLKEGGIHCAGGSDSPIEVPSPFEGMHAAVFRPRRQYSDMRQHRDEWLQLMHDAKGLPAAERGERLRQWCGGSWMREECLDVRQALELYTADGAYCAGKEGELGVLAAGYLADFVVVDCDFVRDPHSLLFASVEEVWVAGVRRK